MEKKPNIFKWLYLALGFAAATSPGRAAELPTSSVLDYPAGFFAGAELATAYDMIQRLPGFVFDDGKNDQRGFAGTAGNVLIDGARPTAKTDDLESILTRIPARRVARIEVIRGGAPGIDMQGQSVVANVILKTVAATSLIATLDDYYFGDGHNMPGGSLELSGQDAARSYQVTLTRYTNINDDSSGDGTYTFVTPGAATQTGSLKRRDADQTGWGLNAQASLPLWGGLFGANATVRRTTYNSRVLYGAPESASYFDGEKALPIEIGLNWDGHVGKSEITLLALQRLEHDESLNTSDAGAQYFYETRHTGESILRGTLNYAAAAGLNLEAGLEGAYNSLNGVSTYLLAGVAQTVPGADARVNERRGEVFAQGTWAFQPGWSLEAGVRGEFSRISALGVPSRSFAFAKPRVLLSWSPWVGHQFRARVERVVGQLDFSNFVASSDLSGVGISAGNLALRPDSRWQFEGDYEFHFWNKGAVTAGYMHEDISDLVDYVPIGGGLDGPGNIPKAANDEIKLSLILPLDRLGDAGGQFKGQAQWDDSAVRDPVTGETRPISDQENHVFKFDFIQDIPAWKSSLDLFTEPFGYNRPSYRIDQVNQVRLLTDYFALTWDYRPEPDLDLIMEATNFIPYRLGLNYFNYAGPRGSAPLAQAQYLQNESEPWLYVKLRRTF